MVEPRTLTWGNSTSWGTFIFALLEYCLENDVLETIERGRAVFDLHTKKLAPNEAGGIRPGTLDRALNRFHRRFEPRRRTRQTERATPGISLQPLAQELALRGCLKTEGPNLTCRLTPRHNYFSKEGAWSTH